tara:strand:+ start:244 stop:567 length:324 start_codon:yes stop_codon:yes gene_type:complete
MAENKFLYFQDGNDDAYCYPLSSFLGFQHAADGTLLMRFVSVVTGPGATTEIDLVTLTLASNKEKDAITDIVARINGQKTGVITIADNVNQVYASTHITDVAGTLDS